MSNFSKAFSDGKTKAQIVTSDGFSRFGGGLLKATGAAVLGLAALTSVPVAGAAGAVILTMGIGSYVLGAAAQANGTLTVPKGSYAGNAQDTTKQFMGRLAKFATNIKPF